MIWCLWTSLWSSFRSPSFADLIPLGAHDDLVPPDSLSTLQLSQEWRKFIGAVLGEYFDRAVIGVDEADIDDLQATIDAFWGDFYN